MVTDLWQTSGLRVWQRDGADWTTKHAACGVPQGDPLAAWIYSITQRWLIECNPVPPQAVAAQQWQHERVVALSTPVVSYVDDTTLWGSGAQLGPSYKFYGEALAQGGLKLKQAKCHRAGARLLARCSWMPAARRAHSRDGSGTDSTGGAADPERGEA